MPNTQKIKDPLVKNWIVTQQSSISEKPQNQQQKKDHILRAFSKIDRGMIRPRKHLSFFYEKVIIGSLLKITVFLDKQISFQITSYLYDVRFYGKCNGTGLFKFPLRLNWSDRFLFLRLGRWSIFLCWDLNDYSGSSSDEYHVIQITSRKKLGQTVKEIELTLPDPLLFGNNNILGDLRQIGTQASIRHIKC